MRQSDRGVGLQEHSRCLTAAEAACRGGVWGEGAVGVEVVCQVLDDVSRGQRLPADRAGLGEQVGAWQAACFGCKRGWSLAG